MATESAAATASAISRQTTDRKRKRTGAVGEQLIADRLAAEGFAIVGRNVRVGPLELDIVARRGGLLVVCEVRTRAGRAEISPAATVTAKKLARLRRAAARWIQIRQLGKVNVRFDVAAVTLRQGEEPRVDYYENVSMPFRWER